MAVQIVNGYAFNVKRLSLMGQTQGPPSAASGALPLVGYPSHGRYMGEEVFVIASSLPNAQAVLTAQYGADLGPVTGGAAVIPGALTTMTGN